MEEHVLAGLLLPPRGEMVASLGWGYICGFIFLASMLFFFPLSHYSIVFLIQCPLQHWHKLVGIRVTSRHGATAVGLVTELQSMLCVCTSVPCQREVLI